MIKILINISKKVPISGIDYASTSASCSLEGEIANGENPAAEAAKLYRQAEQAVDQQLGFTAPSPAPSTPSSPPSAPSSSQAASLSPASTPAPNASRSYPRSSRSVALVTPSQRSLIDRLLRQTHTDAGAVLQHYQIGSLDQLACRQASELIDELKARVAGSVRA